jgi:hypothetical protein
MSAVNSTAVRIYRTCGLYLCVRLEFSVHTVLRRPDRPGPETIAKIEEFRCLLEMFGAKRATIPLGTDAISNDALGNEAAYSVKEWIVLKVRQSIIT